ncbi:MULTISPECIES: flagellar basal body rod protein FlgF [unclassified Brenneria]|uniref:flagellar basal body rod protein FlgF n=1 Tax=unclassified Brenneria TaxID=2634434 RepID=UPI0015572475|nr:MULTISPECIES: flagellar basal body rod protein FlgF [unclassified Brenneria]MBJ7220409.1 flagellar basal body rod protein FlgF [Brenneria sp. L3-3C-1]MEE3641653.1 flagellar basal body rod protein FlgF [Brenneria sp. L3_3C_1]MEE3649716.1 flagellar basal body rod protein FlgF [Brenneria sp. HEZEL_4_2_4]NPC99674.1 flagellar basal body rod protein FlgF [Brenneria sp. hezel4-2-4]
MDHAIYTAMGAASQTLEQHSVIANNLANSSTPGFRAQLTAMRAVPVEGPTLQTRTLVVASTPMADTSQGPLNYTGRSLDVALQDQGWLAVQLPNGEEAYTRNGGIQVDAEGQLRIQGYPVVGDGGLLAVPTQASITIAADGTVSALGDGDNPNTIAQVGALKLVSSEPGQLVRGDDGLFHLSDAARQQAGNALPDDDAVRVMPGVLEGSNVNTVDALVDMIGNSRRFEMQMKIISSVDQNAERANQLLSVS